MGYWLTDSNDSKFALMSHFDELENQLPALHKLPSFQPLWLFFNYLDFGIQSLGSCFTLLLLLLFFLLLLLLLLLPESRHRCKNVSRCQVCQSRRIRRRLRTRPRGQRLKPLRAGWLRSLTSEPPPPARSLIPSLLPLAAPCLSSLHSWWSGRSGSHLPLWLG